MEKISIAYQLRHLKTGKNYGLYLTKEEAIYRKEILNNKNYIIEEVNVRGVRG